MTDWNDTTKASIVVPQTGEGGPRRAYLIVLGGSNLGDIYEVRDGLVLGRSSEADLRFTDEGVSRRHAALRFDAAGVSIEDLGSRNGTFVEDQKINRALLKDGDRVRIGSSTILKYTHQDKLDEDFQRQLFEAALRDALTKAFNKKYFLDRLANEVAFADRHHVELAVIMFDIDMFKVVNDTYGHLAGDQVLSAVARAVHESVRCEDVFARFGGDEFSVICRGVNAAGARVLADRLRVRIAALDCKFEEKTIKVTASFGVADLAGVGGGDPATLLRASDEALYAAKSSGRNMVRLHGSAA
jgi:two-component system cell cycle response regulator